MTPHHLTALTIPSAMCTVMFVLFLGELIRPRAICLMKSLLLLALMLLPGWRGTKRQSYSCRGEAHAAQCPTPKECCQRQCIRISNTFEWTSGDTVTVF